MPHVNGVHFIPPADILLTRTIVARVSKKTLLITDHLYNDDMWL